MTECTRDSPDTPDRFLCPISMVLMSHPVRTETGHVFERRAILEWCYFGKATCPMSRKPLHPSGFVRDVALEEEINLWRQKHNLPMAADEDHEEDYEEEDSDDDEEDEILPTGKVLQKNDQMGDLLHLRAKVLQNRDRRLASFQQSRRL